MSEGSTRRAHIRGDWREVLLIVRILALVLLNIILVVLLGKTLPPVGSPFSASDSATVHCEGDIEFPPVVFVQFELNASGGEGPYVYSWSFGDGTSNVSATPYTEHAYFSPGEFEVTGVIYDVAKHYAIANPIYVNASRVTC